MSQIRVSRFFFTTLRYYIGGVIEIYYSATRGGGLPDLLQYYKGEGGSLGTPNLYYVIYGRPLNMIHNSKSLLTITKNDFSELKWMQ